MSAIDTMNPKGLLFPTIHSNGTSKTSLEQQIEEAHAAIRNAEEKLAEAAPNGRDYYPQEITAFYKAQDQHLDRMQRLHSVRLELETIAEHLAFQ
jgi:hypothetical protein